MPNGKIFLKIHNLFPFLTGFFFIEAVHFNLPATSISQYRLLRKKNKRQGVPVDDLLGVLYNFYSLPVRKEVNFLYMIYDCIIVGAGAAGLFCGAVFQSDCKINGLILEKTGRPGTKLLMSGGGQCNITHDGSIKDFIEKYGKNGGKIRSCLYKYNNLHLMEFLRQGGVPTVVRDDGKVFPQSMKASDILHLLLKRSAEKGFKLLTDTPVTSLKEKVKPGEASLSQKAPEPASNLWQVNTPKGSFVCRHLIIATGGCSYPSSGSDGSMLQILQRDPGIRLIEPRPALTPVFAENYPYGHLSGISFPRAGLQVYSGTTGKRIAQGCGPLLLTHENFSGPLILNFSKDITKNDKIVLNYLYPCDKTVVLDRLNRAAKHSKASTAGIISREFGLPKNFATAVALKSGASAKAAAANLTEDTYTVKALGDFQKAMVTTGGADLSQINCRTMECKDHPGLFLIGEVLDVDGATGGYNLQFAYSSACAAAAALQGPLRTEQEE